MMHNLTLLYSRRELGTIHATAFQPLGKVFLLPSLSLCWAISTQLRPFSFLLRVAHMLVPKEFRDLLRVCLVYRYFVALLCLSCSLWLGRFALSKN